MNPAMAKNILRLFMLREFILRASCANTCVACPNSSAYSTCGWGSYRNLNDCMPDRPSGCFPCRGTLPGNATWTSSKWPHYFDSTEPNPCNWDCTIGYFKKNGVCEACTKIPNSAFSLGPQIPIGMESNAALQKQCLDPSQPTSCRYFGGLDGYGCKWGCLDKYELSIPQVGLGVTACVACEAVTCPTGQVKVVADTSCDTCQTCPSVANAVYSVGADCPFTCTAGYYKNSASSCRLCSDRTCTTGQYSGGCGMSSDNICKPCSSCPIGSNATSPCTATSDTTCTACQTQPPMFGLHDANCNVICRAGYVMSGSSCVICAVTTSDCMNGYFKASTCTAQNLGCDACVAPLTYNWCWLGTSSDCSWDCARYYRKTGGVCNADSTKATSPSCASQMFVAPATSLEPVLYTTGTTIRVVDTTVNKISTTGTTVGTTGTTVGTTTTRIGTTVGTTVGTTGTKIGTVGTTVGTTTTRIGTVGTTVGTTGTKIGTTGTTVGTTGTKIGTVGTTVGTTGIPSTTIHTTSTTVGTIGSTNHTKTITTTTMIDTTATTTNNPVIRETLTVENMTIAQCTCSSSKVASEFSAEYGTVVYVLSCENGLVLVECVNFTCPCTSARRLLLDSTTTQYKFVHQNAIYAPNITQLLAAIRRAIPNAHVQSRSTETLDVTSIVWSSALATWMPASDSPPSLALPLAIVAVALAVLAGIVIYFNRQTAPPPRNVILIKIPSELIAEERGK